jgi:hypothetical protein
MARGEGATAGNGDGDGEASSGDTCDVDAGITGDATFGDAVLSEDGIGETATAAGAGVAAGVFVAPGLAGEVPHAVTATTIANPSVRRTHPRGIAPSEADAAC